jgi:hypothetical protein
VTYKIDLDPQAIDQIRALPPEVTGAFREALTVLELVPWNGLPYNDDLPDGSLRELLFGPDSLGKVSYLILEDQRRVDVLNVVWLS